MTVDTRKSLDYRKLLLLWVGYQLRSKSAEGTGSDTIPSDFKTSFKDGCLYVRLLAKIVPPELLLPVDVDLLLDKTKTSADQRLDFIVKQAKAIGLGEFIQATDIVHGYDRVNLTFVSQLLRLFPTIDTFTILITRGIQNDYCGVNSKSPVHIGVDEALRLETHETSVPSPIVSLVLWARQQPPSSFALVHIRDMHDPHDQTQVSHLDKFGNHCLKGSDGAKLIDGLLEDETQLAPNEHVINVTIGISDTVNTGLEQLIASLKAKSRGCLLRVGVVGVPTDFQITNLLFELQTRMGIIYLATCSALTAAKNRRAHFAALDNIERLLDVVVFHSIQDFTFWLVPTNVSPVPGDSTGDVICWRSSWPSRVQMTATRSPKAILDKIDFDEKHLLLEEDCLIMENLFRTASRIVIVSKLTGGFSGAMVLLAKSYDLEGHEQGPFVLKLGQIESMAQERINFERVEEIIGNQAPYIYGSYEALKRAGLKFAFASHVGDIVSTTTFRRAYADAQSSQSFIDQIITKVASVLNRFYTVAKLQPFDLLKSYDFDGRGWALAAGGSDEPQALTVRIAALVNVLPSALIVQPSIEFGNGTSFFNVLHLMANLDVLRLWCSNQQFLVSFVHGDLNYSNILIDASVNIWLIDFQYTYKSHYLKDLAKLENDAMTELSLSSHEEFDYALQITQLLHKYSPYNSQSDFEEECRKLLQTLPTKLQRVTRTIMAVRTLIRSLNITREADDRSYHITMLRYALHSMCFHHLSHWTRKWCLAAACSHAQRLVEMIRKDGYSIPTSSNIAIPNSATTNLTDNAPPNLSPASPPHTFTPPPIFV